MAAKAKLIATIIGNAMSENKTDEDKISMINYLPFKKF